MRWFAAGAAAAVVVLGLLALARGLWLRDTATPVSLSEQVRRLGRGAVGGPTAAAGGPRIPPSGVYVYATRGGERFESLLDASHEYPARTTITVSRGGCGVLMRWVALEERETTLDLCPGRGGWGLRRISEAHEFFGQRDERTYECAGGVAFRLRGRWAYRCVTDSEETVDEFRGRVLGLETLTVAGRRLRTVHVRERDLLAGRTDGAGTSETWYRVSDGLIVKRTVSNRDRTPVPGGTGTYSERYQLRLSSLEPAR